MKLSIQIAVVLIVGLLFLASLISVYFALGNQEVIPLTLVALANIIAVILLTFLITRGVIYPLAEIRKVMKRVGEGNLAQRIRIQSTREMEEVGEAFNEMILRLEKAQQAVQDSNKILEQRVKERTMQLRELAESLEEKVGARTKELQEKVEQLERFQKLAVGRELRMLELKKEIQQLGKKERQRSSKNKNKKQSV